MKHVILVSVVLLLISGCSGDSTERIAMLNQWMIKANDISREMETQAAKAELILENLQKLQSDPKLSSEQSAKIITAIQESAAKVQGYRAKKAEVDQALVVWQSELQALQDAGDVTIGQEIGAWGSGLTAVAPSLGPAAPWAALIGAVLSGIGTGVVGKKKMTKLKAEKMATDTTLTDVVTSVKSLLDSDMITDASKAADVLKDNQSKRTVATVRHMLDPSYPPPQ